MTSSTYGTTWLIFSARTSVCSADRARRRRSGLSSYQWAKSDKHVMSLHPTCMRRAVERLWVLPLFLVLPRHSFDGRGVCVRWVEGAGR